MGENGVPHLITRERLMRIPTTTPASRREQWNHFLSFTSALTPLTTTVMFWFIESSPKNNPPSSFSRSHHESPALCKGMTWEKSLANTRYQGPFRTSRAFWSISLRFPSLTSALHVQETWEAAVKRGINLHSLRSGFSQLLSPRRYLGPDIWLCVLQPPQILEALTGHLQGLSICETTPGPPEPSGPTWAWVRGAAGCAKQPVFILVLARREIAKMF